MGILDMGFCWQRQVFDNASLLAEPVIQNALWHVISISYCAFYGVMPGISRVQGIRQ